MNPLLVVAAFEFRYHLRQPTSLLFAALIFGQGVWYTYQPDNLYLAQNSAIQAYTILSSLGIALTTVTILLAGQSLMKDSAYKTTAYLYTLPITSRTHFAGRFLGTLFFALLLAIFYPLGVMLTLAINATPDLFSLIALADGFVWLVIPNVFICVSIAFSLTVLLRGIWSAYVYLFLAVLYFLLTDHQTEMGAYDDSWQLLDLFAVGMIRESIDKMSFLPDSENLLSFSDSLLVNRLFWIGLSLGALAQAEARFSFDTFAPKTPLQKPVAERSLPNIYTLQSLPSIRLQFDGWVPLGTTFRVAQLECQALIRQPIFRLTAGLLILLTLLLATVFNLNPDFPELPVTSRMTALREPMGLFIGLFLLVITGELFFQERTVGFWPIFDALPQPDAVLLAGKLLALIGIAALLTVALFLTGVSLQIGNGFSDIDWPLYRDDLLIDGFFRYCQLIILGSCVAVLVNNRLMSHIINLLIFSLLTVGYQANSPDQQRWFYSFLPGSAAYSDLIGYGTQAPVRLALLSIWWGVASILLCLFLLTWNRGVSGGLRARINHFRHQWSRRYVLLVLVSLLLVGAGFWKLAQPTIATPEFIAQYKNKTASFQSLSGKPIAITVTYHHPYQVPHMLLAIQAALRKGETLFGAYPYSTIQIYEMPITQSGVSSTPGNILIPEKQGWIANNRQPTKLDYIDYLISREVFKQWLVHRLRPTHKPGDGFVRQSLAEYLALQTVAEQYGPERLQQRLAQRTTLYVSGRNRSRKPEIPALQSSGNDAVERGRAALALTSIGQVWGNAPLSLTISQFYQKALNKPTEATANAFGQQLTSQLPDSLKYLTTYISKPLWFDVKLGRIANLANGLTIEIISAKWQEDIPGVQYPLSNNDFVPLVILDRNGREIYRQLVRLNSDQSFVSLPTLPSAKAVLIDPLGAWPEQKKHDNYKLL